MGIPHIEKFQGFWLAEHEYGRYNAFDNLFFIRSGVYFIKTNTGISDMVG